MKSHKVLMAMAVVGALAFAGPARANHEDMHGDMHHHMMGEGCCDKNLPPEKAKMAEGAMHSVMEKNKPLMERMRRLHEKMRALGTADKFDKKAFLATGDEMAALHMKMEKNRMAMMASVAEKLTASERRAMADCMESRFHHGDPGHGKWGHEGHPEMENSHNDNGSFNQ